MVFRRSLALCLLASLGLSMTPVASWAQGTKFATVDMARVLREYEQVKRVAQMLQAKKDEFQETIDKKQQEIKNLNDEIQKADAGQKGELEKKKKQKLIALQNQFQKLKEQLGEMEKQEFDSIKDQIYAEIDKIAQTKGVGMILEKQWLYYPRKTEDLTDELLRSLDSNKGATKKAPKSSEGSSEE